MTTTGKIVDPALTYDESTGLVKVVWGMDEAVASCNVTVKVYRVSDGTSYLFNTMTYSGSLGTTGNMLPSTKAVNVDGAYYASIVIKDASGNTIDTAETEQVNLAH